MEEAITWADSPSALTAVTAPAAARPISTERKPCGKTWPFLSDGGWIRLTCTLERHPGDDHYDHAFSISWTRKGYTDA